MITWDGPRSTLRLAESVFAFVCALLWLGLPLPPGDLWPTSLYLAGTSVTAAMVAWMFRRPTIAGWYAAAALSGGVIVTQGLRLPAIVALARGQTTTPAVTYATDGMTVFDGSLVAALIITLGVLPLVLQLIVAVCCYRLRYLRHQVSPEGRYG